MSTYQDFIDQEYDAAAAELGQLISVVILNERGLAISGLGIGDTPVQPFLYDNSKTAMLMFDILTHDNLITDITIWSDVDELKLPLSIPITDDIQVAYCKMMNGVHLWHANQFYMSSPLPSIEYKNHINNQ